MVTILLAVVAVIAAAAVIIIVPNKHVAVQAGISH